MERSTALAASLRGDAAGGRVVHSAFLEPDDADALLRAVRGPGVAAGAWGGFAGARRRVVTVWPEHVPSATTALAAWYLAAAHAAEDEVRAALRFAGVAAEAVGDVVRHSDGCSVVVLASAPVPERVTLDGRTVAIEVVPVERTGVGAVKRLTVVVPALRVDVLGARAFGVSRSWFAKGVAAGHVQINGRPADKRSEAASGDVVWAQGLGRFTVVRVLGETRRGNRKVELEVERA